MPDDWRTVREFEPIHQDGRFELRVAIVENRTGFGVRVAKYRRDPRTGEMLEGARSVIVYPDRLPALMLSLQEASETITVLRRAGRRVA